MGYKMKKLVTTILTVLLVGLLTGCSAASTNSPTPYTPTSDEPPDNATWISPGKVMVTNFYPGARAEYPLLIHNGNSTTASFNVQYRHPDHVDGAYVKAPAEAQDWVIIVDPTPVLMPRETREILIVLAMPKDANIDGKKFEFWISVMDATQSGTVRTELCSRWLVSMR